MEILILFCYWDPNSWGPSNLLLMHHNYKSKKERIWRSKQQKLLDFGFFWIKIGLTVFRFQWKYELHNTRNAKNKTKPPNPPKTLISNLSDWKDPLNSSNAHLAHWSFCTSILPSSVIHLNYVNPWFMQGKWIWP